jgi:DNA-binding winged helix-turn-helix (wHTH) protein/tetratricopeptide (TPR) repeat protein
MVVKSGGQDHPSRWPASRETGARAMTAEDPTPARFVRLGPFLVDVTSGEVTRNRKRIHLAEQPTRLLLALLARPGEIVSRDELRGKLWPDDTNVEFSHSIHAAVNKLRQALGDSPEQPQFIETIPRRGYRLLASSGAITFTDTEQIHSGAAGVTVPFARHYKTGFLIAGTILLSLTVLIAALSYFTSKPRSETAQTVPSVPMVSVPRRIAIVGFRNLSNRSESAWLSTAFSEMLATELGTSADLQPVSSEDVAQTKRELSLPDADSYTQQTLNKLQQSLGAELVVSGSFMPIGRGRPSDRVRFNIHLQDTKTGETVASLSETGTVSGLFDLISDAGLHLRMRLGATPLSSLEQAEIQRSMPANSAAQRLYFSGLEKLRNFDYKDAREVFIKALAADPKHSLAHEALSVAYGSSGYESLAAKEAKLAYDLAKGVTYEQGLQIEGRYFETRHEWTRSEDSYRRLSSLSPQNIDYSLHLAGIQGIKGSPDEAIATLGRAAVLSHSARDIARIRLAEAAAEQQLGDSKSELAAAKAAAVQGEQAHAPLVIARALRMQGVALGYLGDTTQALSDEHQAEKIFAALNDPGGLADVLIDEGDILSDLGEMSAAESAWRRALEQARNAANKQKESVVSNNLGNVFLMRGEPDQARKLYKHAYELSLELDDKVGQASALLTIGDAYQAQGQLSRARTQYEQCLKLSTEIAHRQVRAEALESLAGVLVDLGDPAEAKRFAEEALIAAQTSGDKSTETSALIYLGQALASQGSLTEAQSTAQKARTNADALAAKSLQAGSRMVLALAVSLEGDAVGARANYEQALALAESIKASTEEREIRYALAQAAIEEQRPSDAKEMLRLLKIGLNHEKNVDAELECLILQARLELLDNQRDAALASALRGQAVSRHDERLDLKMSAAEVLVKAAGASRKFTQADQVLDSALVRASQSGCLACELQAKLSACNLKADREAKDTSVCFANLQKAAESKGFGRIAKNAALKAHTLHRVSSRLSG